MTSKDIGARIQEARETLGWSRIDLAAAMLTDRSLIRKWESGEVYPSLRSIRRLCKMLRVSVKDLLG